MFCAIVFIQMEVITLKDCQDSWYYAFLKIYSVSFPVFEQRTVQQQCKAFMNSVYSLDCYIEQDCMVGFIAYWKFDTYIYVEHFAIHPDKRGQNRGSFILNDLINKTDRRIVLEIDPPVDEISRKRLQFYRSHGFSENPYEHFHPAYRKGIKDHLLVVLSTGGKMVKQEYQRFSADLIQIIMK